MLGKDNRFPLVKEVSDELVALVEIWMEENKVDYTYDVKEKLKILGDMIRNRFTWIMTGEGAVKRVEITDSDVAAIKDRLIGTEKAIIRVFDKFQPEMTFTDPLQALEKIEGMLEDAYLSAKSNRIQMLDDVPQDNWKHRAANMTCATCMWYVPKHTGKIGRCRASAPTMKGWPVMFPTDWCGNHKLDEGKI